MGFEIGLPCILDSGLKGQHQHPLCTEFLGEFIAGEGLAETHLRIPEEARDCGFILLPAGMIVGVGLFHRLRLFLARREILMVGAGELLPRAQLGQRGFHIRDCAGHPFELGIGETLPPQSVANSMIGDDGAVLAFGAFI